MPIVLVFLFDLKRLSECHSGDLKRYFNLVVQTIREASLPLPVKWLFLGSVWNQKRSENDTCLVSLKILYDFFVYNHIPHLTLKGAELLYYKNHNLKYQQSIASSKFELGQLVTSAERISFTSQVNYRWQIRK